jgi:hypothetical protein
MTKPKQPKVKHTSSFKKPPANAGFWQVFWYNFTAWSVRHKFWQRLAIGLTVLTVLFFGGMYGIAQWYINKHKNEPLIVGATFIPDYARYLQVDPQETLDAMINDLGIKHFRLVSYWKNIEPKEGQYDFSELDWQMDMVEKAGGKVSLAIGLRQPRWPECHGPEWAMIKSKPEWKEDLLDYMNMTINRYKDSPALESYQLENEYFLDVFGQCPDHSRDRLVEEFDFVKSKDPNHPIIVSRSNNATVSWPINQPRADMVAASIYKRVWDKTITKRYFEYPLPAWFYGFLAGATELTTGRNTFIHELQTEAWLPENRSMRTESIDELYKTMSPEKLSERIQYAKDTGMKRFDLWGVEWWFQLKKSRQTPEIWNTAKQEIQKINQQ